MTKTKATNGFNWNNFSNKIKKMIILDYNPKNRISILDSVLTKTNKEI